MYTRAQYVEQSLTAGFETCYQSENVPNRLQAQRLNGGGDNQHRILTIVSVDLAGGQELDKIVFFVGHMTARNKANNLQIHRKHVDEADKELCNCESLLEI